MCTPAHFLASCITSIVLRFSSSTVEFGQGRFYLEYFGWACFPLLGTSCQLISKQNKGSCLQSIRRTVRTSRRPAIWACSKSSVIYQQRSILASSYLYNITHTTLVLKRVKRSLSFSCSRSMPRAENANQSHVKSTTKVSIHNHHSERTRPRTPRKRQSVQIAAFFEA